MLSATSNGAPRALVTGAAGFVGSHLVEGLAGAGFLVRGVDSLTPYYDVASKRRSVVEIRRWPDVEFVRADLCTADLASLLAGVDVVFHQAGQPGVRASWGGFEQYLRHNVLGTQRLLEAARAVPLARFVFASSSSVYGNAPGYPTHEDAVPRPQSPYGVTKLAAEHLCGVYARNFGVPTVALRYFTVYGPRQRPDMAMHRLVEAVLSGAEFPVYGSGAQVRDFTYVGDVVAANLRAAAAALAPGTVINVAGGSACTLTEVIGIVERLTGRRARLAREPAKRGDVERTGADITRARTLLGWRPEVTVEEGLARQVGWQRDLVALRTGAAVAQPAAAPG